MSGINGDWYEALKGEFKKPYYKTLFNTVNEEYRTRQIFPPANDIFNAFHLTPLKDVKVGPVPQFQSGARAVLLGEKGSAGASVSG
jgi:uracil DNA glycosylase